MTQFPTIRVFPPRCSLTMLVVFAISASCFSSVEAFQRRPASVANLVVVQFEGQPAFTGLHFRRFGNRSLVYCPFDQPRRYADRKINRRASVKFFPGQARKESTHDARIISQVPDKFCVLEVVSDSLSPPLPMGGSQTPLSADQPLRLFGILSDAEEQPASAFAIRAVAATFARPPREDDRILPLQYDQKVRKGALVCDAKGTPLGITIPLSSVESTPHGAVRLSYLEKAMQIHFTGSFHKLTGIDGSQHFVLRGMFVDPFRQADRVEVLLGRAESLSADFEVGLTQYDQPATDRMEIVPSSTGSPEPGSITAVLPPGLGLSDQVNIILQAKITVGTDVRYTPPQVIQSRSVDPYRRVVPVTEDLLEKYADKKAEDTAFDWPIPTPEIVDSNRQLIRNLKNSVRIAGRDLVNNAAWSADGKRCFLIDRFGNLMALNAEDPGDRVRLQLHAWAEDIAMSGSAVLVLAQQSLVVIDPVTLAIRTSIPVPGGRAIAACAASDVAWVVCPDHVLKVQTNDVNDQAPVTLPAKTPATSQFPLHTIMVTPDGKHLVLADNEQLHRFEITSDASLAWQESSPRLPFSKVCLRQAESNRIAWVSGDRQSTVSGFPSGGILVFDASNLSQPEAGFVQPVGMDPFSGGLLKSNTTNRPLTFVRSDGSATPEQLESRYGDLNFASFCPSGGSVLTNQQQYTSIQPVPESVTRHSLRVAPLKDTPTVEDVDLKGASVTTGEWTATNLDFADDVDSVVWLNAKTAVLLTTDGTLHRVRFPECVRDASLKLPVCSNLISTREGLVTQGTDRQLLFLVDSKSLKKLREIPLSSHGLMTGCPSSPLVWKLTNQGSRVSNSRYASVQAGYGLSCIDLRTGNTVADFDAGTLNSLATSANIPSCKSPWIFTFDPKEIRLSPDGKYLFIRDARDLIRFRVQQNSLKFDDALWRISAGNSGPLSISPDSRFVAVTHGAIGSRRQHPAGGHYGSFVFPISDFSRVTVEAVSNTACRSVALLKGGQQLMFASAEYPLAFIRGKKQVPVPLKAEGKADYALLSVSPQGSVLAFGKSVTFLSRED